MKKVTTPLHSDHLDRHFSRYSRFEPILPVWRVSPDGLPATHRFFDTSPISPSGRFIALTQFEADDHVPRAGEVAQVVVVDLTTGETVFRKRTYGWDSQLGAQVQWGATDRELIYNDVDTLTWRPFGVVADIETQSCVHLDTTVYMASHDGQEALSPCLRRIADTQAGYGVVVPAQYRPTFCGPSEEDGVWRVDLKTGRSRLWLSTREIVDRLPTAFSRTDLETGNLYVFHVKWSPDDQRVMIVLRFQGGNRRSRSAKTWLVTTDRDAKQLHVALGPNAWVGGHHPNWCPDSTRIIMNVVLPLQSTWLLKRARSAERLASRLGVFPKKSIFNLRFVSFRFDGTDLQCLSDKFLGSGHPTYNASSEAILSDAYPHEAVAFGDGTVPLRWIASQGTSERTLVRMPVEPPFRGPKAEWRVDMHPAWDRQGRFVVFNGAPDGLRSVFVADFGEITAKATRQQT